MTWQHIGEIVAFTFTPSLESLRRVVSGFLKIAPLTLGADAFTGDYLNSDFEFGLDNFDPEDRPLSTDRRLFRSPHLRVRAR